MAAKAKGERKEINGIISGRGAEWRPAPPRERESEATI